MVFSIFVYFTFYDAGFPNYVLFKKEKQFFTSTNLYKTEALSICIMKKFQNYLLVLIIFLKTITQKKSSD